MGNSHLLDTLGSLPHGTRLYIRDNRHDNWGVAKSWNWGINAVLADGLQYALVLNDDIRLNQPRAFVEALVQSLKLPDVVLSSGRPEDASPQIPQWDLPHMGAFMVDHRLFDLVGPFDELFWPAYFEDDDMRHRIKLQALRTFSPLHATYFHWRSSTIKELPKMRLLNKIYFKKNRQRFFDKWGFYP